MIRQPDMFDAMCEAMSRFVRDKLVPLEAEVDETGVIPDSALTEMREMGMAGLSIPAEFGGSGLTVEEKVRMAFVLGWTTPVFHRRYGPNDGPAYGILHAGTEAQKNAYLPRLASGEWTGSFALTEPEAGSDAGSLRTTALKDGNEFVLNGNKRFITNAPHADIFMVMARSDPSARGASGVSAFLVEADSPGLHVAPADRKMGLNGNDTADVTFSDCRIPASAQIGGPGEGFKLAMRRLDIVRIEAAALAVGNARRLIQESLDYATGRQQFGQPISGFQLVQAMLADSEAQAYAAETMVIDAARRFDAGESVSTEAACCKLFATEMVGHVADHAVQIQGGAGFMRASAVERFYRDVRVYRIYDGTNQIQKLVIARNLLKAAGGAA
ncbi:MAG: acyl-CoA dehydrogenase family protein [Pseudomonadota bacterium]